MRPWLNGILAILLAGNLLLEAKDLVPVVPSAVLMDFTSGRLLFQKNPDLTIPPASLTKLMTLHLAWKALASGAVHANDAVPVLREVLDLVPEGSSLMFLEAGQIVHVNELMLGLAVVSGNDAALVLAHFLAGSQQEFVSRMNAEAQALGLDHTQFYDSYGFSPQNRTTVRDFARFCRLYLQAHPQSLELLHRVKSLAYPLQENLAPTNKRPLRTIVQMNRNSLLESYPGADGLKTGYIEESGYNLAATALRGQQRLIAVLLGVPGHDAASGSQLRAHEASVLLDFGFQNYPLRALPVPTMAPVKVWYSEAGAVEPGVMRPPEYPLSEEEFRQVTVRAEVATQVLGPFNRGAVLGRLIWSRGTQDFYSQSVVSLRTLKPAPWWQVVGDAVGLFFQGLFGGKPVLKPIGAPSS